jgi:hypothetical protein
MLLVCGGGTLLGLLAMLCMSNWRCQLGVGGNVVLWWCFQ